MKTPDIIQAEVVEVPKPERPELWIALFGDHGEWWGSCLYETKEQLESAYRDQNYHAVAKIPGTQPAPAPATDVVAATTELCKLGHYVEYAYDGDDIWCSVRDAGRPPITQQSGATADIAAARCLAKIRGAK